MGSLAGFYFYQLLGHLCGVPYNDGEITELRLQRRLRTMSLDPVCSF